MKYLLITILFSPITLLAQAGQIHGTVLIATVASDGILIVADSRMAIVGENNQTVAYWDGACKITLLNNFPIGMSGSSLIGNSFIYNLIDSFNYGHVRKDDINQSFIEFKKYLQQKASSINTMFIGGGYYNNVPYIFSFSNSSQSADSSGFVFNEPDLTSYLQPYQNARLTCAEFAPILEKIIYQYAKDKRKEATIGGSISMVKIVTGNNVVWMQNNFMNNKQKDYATFLQYVKEGKITLTPLVPNGVSLAIDAMKKRIDSLNLK